MYSAIGRNCAVESIQRGVGYFSPLVQRQIGWIDLVPPELRPGASGYSMGGPNRYVTESRIEGRVGLSQLAAESIDVRRRRPARRCTRLRRVRRSAVGWD